MEQLECACNVQASLRNLDTFWFTGVSYLPQRVLPLLDCHPTLFAWPLPCGVDPCLPAFGPCMLHGHGPATALHRLNRKGVTYRYV